LTLVEVVAGLALLATLAVSLVLAMSAHRRQMAQARRQLEAVEIADRLLTAWYASPTPPPRNEIGVALGTSREWIWQTRPLRSEAIGMHLFEVVRLEVFPRDDYEPRRPSSYVDILIPVPQEDEPDA
jgi:type II secretory pathway pseudopilin PulG